MPTLAFELCQLRTAEEHITSAERHVTRLERRIAAEHQAGLDAAPAEAFLDTMVDVVGALWEHRALIMRAVEDLRRAAPGT